MVEPIYIVGSGLGIAFLLGIIKKAGKNTSGIIMLLTIAFMTFVSVQWLWSVVFAGNAPHYTFTAGFKPPFSINLLMGRHEAILTTMINALGLLGGLYLWDKFKKEGVNSMIVYLVMIMGLNVIIMTRDIFNLFVFLEVASIGVAGLVVLERNTKSLSAGFKYMIATSIIAGILLLGIIFSYKLAGSLNIDDLVNSNIWFAKGGTTAVFLVLIAVIFELKPFPANGWALDLYEGANPGLAALVSGGIATASLFILFKLMHIGGESWYIPIATTGMITFIGSNLLGINQKNSTRLLGYSSVGQVGLIMIVLGFSSMLGNKFEFIAFGILISHFLAKAGLFWIAGLLKNTRIKNWGIIRSKPFMLFLMGTFILALVGMPPFPSFFGKWEFIMKLAENNMLIWIAGILIGSVLEAVYLFRWFGYAAKMQPEEENGISFSIHKVVPIIFAGLGLYIFSFFSAEWIGLNFSAVFYIPVILVLLLFVLDFLPVYIKNSIGIAGLGYYAYTLIFNDLIPGGDILRIVFAIIFLGGGLIMLIPGYTQKGRRQGFYPLVILMFAGLGGLIQAENTLQFFFAWEIMTIASYFLIIRGKNAMKASLNYILFSIGGAYFMLMGFAMAFQAQDSFTLEILNNSTSLTSWIFLLVAIGFMFKIATIGIHIWLPGSYTEAEDDVTPIISAILIKSGVFGFLIFMISGGSFELGNINIPYVLGWIGAISAVIGNMLAIYQEDAKKLVAYSSVGVMGYILFAISMMTSLGWLTAVTYGMIHFLYKGLIFLAVAGVIYRTRTRKFYEMGGLIKKMPISFIAVLIGIITLAGMPPLAGFAGKWIFYNAVILKGWYIQGTLVFFAGIIAFLYCFKLIHNIFLGPIKDEHRRIKETSIWWLIPQVVLIIVIMVFSVQPRIFMEPVGSYLAGYFPGETLQWEGTKASTSLGYWDATQIMYIVGGLFAVLFGALFLLSRKAQKVEQFNMVYQAERPFRPETTHVAYNMFAHYNKALGIFSAPRVTNFWNGFSNLIHDIGNHIRQIYSGNGQAYALHIVLYFIVFYVLLNGGF